MSSAFSQLFFLLSLEKYDEPRPIMFSSTTLNKQCSETMWLVGKITLTTNQILGSFW